MSEREISSSVSGGESDPRFRFRDGSLSLYRTDLVSAESLLVEEGLMGRAKRAMMEVLWLLWRIPKGKRIKLLVRESKAAG